MTCHFEGQQQHGTTTGGSWGGGTEHATFSPGGTDSVGYGAGGKGSEGAEGGRCVAFETMTDVDTQISNRKHTHTPNSAGWMEEEAKAFVKVVQETDPYAPCPKCVNEEHLVCSASLRLMLRDTDCADRGLSAHHNHPCTHSDADDAYEAAAGPDDSAIDPEVRDLVGSIHTVLYQ